MATADVTNSTQMESVIRETVERFGRINGVISAAGIVDESTFQPVERLDRPACDRQFRPKVRGLFVLEQVLSEQPLDFCLIVSSLSSVLGGLGYGSYSAANLFMDAFVRGHNRRHPVPWLAINFDAWRHGDTEQDAAGVALARLAMTAGEGVEVFDHALSAIGTSQVIVSTTDLQARLSQWVEPARRPDRQPENETATRERPADLLEDFEAPHTQTQIAVADVWGCVLGIDRVGVHDNFLDLGGNSLTAIQVIGKLEEELGVQVAIEEFIFQTLGQLATLYDERMKSVRSEPSAVRQTLFRTARMAITRR